MKPIIKPRKPITLDVNSEVTCKDETTEIVFVVTFRSDVYSDDHARACATFMNDMYDFVENEHAKFTKGGRHDSKY